ncbi:MAG: vWA domain-containing protein [Phycisphaeraceae bacterium]
MRLADPKPSTPPDPAPGTPPDPAAEPAQALPEAESPHDEEKASVGEEINNVFMAMLPWGIALLFHAGLILIAAFVAWTTIFPPDEDEVIIPVMAFSEEATEDLDVEADERVDETRNERQVERQERPEESRESDLEQTIDTPTTLVGVEGAADSSPFATGHTSAGQFGTGMFGVRGNARQLVFCIDASGSLIDTLPHVIAELKESIQNLSEQQQFTVVFFQADDVIEVPPPGLRDATSTNKQRVIEWVDLDAYNVIPGGRSNPVNAIRRAMRYRPDLVYLLSDNITGSGRYEISQRDLLREIERANTANTKINTIQFLYPDRLAEGGGRGTMELIARRSGGIYRFISAEDLHLR